MKDRSCIAFFEIEGLPREQIETVVPWARHIALSVDSEEELMSAMRHLKEHDVEVLGPVDHEGIWKSLYFFDPNGIRLEITYQNRTFTDEDSEKAYEDVAAWLAEHGPVKNGPVDRLTITLGSARRQVVVVTGGAQGLGLEYARTLSQRGWHVILADIAGELADNAAASLVAEGATAHATEIDVADPASVEETFARLAKEHGPVAGLVNNAGGAFITPSGIEEMEYADFTRVIGINTGGTWLCTRAVVPGMKEAGRGKIVNISSTCFSKGGPVGMAPYIAAKGGVVGLTRALARELGPFHITVNAVAPGYTPVDTLGRVNTGERAARMRVQIVAEQCMNRTEVPSDLVGTVAFLLSEDSDFLTGQVINVDGGWVHA